jgi:hypothetical protein
MIRRIQFEDKFIEFEVEGVVGVIISSNLSKPCPTCKDVDCYGQCDDGGLVENEKTAKYETEYEWETRFSYNTAIKAIESMILSHSIWGIDVLSSDYVNGIKMALKILNNRIYGQGI